MLFKSLLLLSFLATISASRISIENKCDHDVWIRRQTSNFTVTVIHMRAGKPHWYNITDDGEWLEMLTVKTGCKGEFTDCDNEERDPSKYLSKDCVRAPVTTMITLERVLSLQENSKYVPVVNYAVFLNGGYMVPIEVSVDSEANCESILCNMTLDECPRQERNGAGDLRIKRNGRIVACMAPCVMEERNGVCECDAEEGTEYHKLIDSKCSSEDSMDNFIDREVLRQCPEVERVNITMCP